MKFLKNRWPVVFLVSLVILYFSAVLFFPTPKIFFNPDYGLSDVTHFNLPMRQLLHDSLKERQLPLWSQKVGAGFPIFAENQSGDLSFLNLVTAGLPIWLSFDLSFVLAFLLMAVFAYLFGRRIGLSKISAVLAAVVFTWSGTNWAHFNHLNQIVTVAWIPVEFWLLEKSISVFMEKKVRGRLLAFDSLFASGGWWLLLSLAISQQILGGKLQFVIYSLLALFLYLIFKVWLTYFRSSLTPGFQPVTWFAGTKFLAMVILIFIASTVLALSLSATQILPSMELTNLTLRSGGLSFEKATRFPYPPKHLLTFLNPYFLGDPRVGAYPPFSRDWGIFWENTGYVGLIPLLLVLTTILHSMVVLARKRWTAKIVKREAHILFFSLLVLLFLLLSFGKYSPLAFVFHLPPLDYFRVPSRMLTMVDFGLAVLAGFGLDIFIGWLKAFQTELGKGTLGQIKDYLGRPYSYLPMLLLALTIVDLFYFSGTYSPTIEVSKYFEIPQTAQFLKKDRSQFRILDVGSAIFWNQVFLTKGWKNQKSCYLILRESLAADLNVLWGVESFNSYMGITPVDQVKLMGLINSGILWDGQNTIFIAKDVLKILGTYNVKYLISPFKLSAQDLQEVEKVGLDSIGLCRGSAKLSFTIYENKQALPRVFMVDNIANNFQKPMAASLYRVSSQNYKDNAVSLRVKNGQDGFLVLADSYYPGWKVLADGGVKKIYRINLNERAVFLPKGEHKVEFTYQPESFKKGTLISIAAYMLWAVAWLFLF